MSRAYCMSVAVSGHNAAQGEKIKAAAEAEWSFEDWFDSGEELTASGEGQLCGGETEEEFTERLSLAIWRANGAFCTVTVDATYLEYLPYESHCLDEADYARLVAGGPKSLPGESEDEDHADCGD